MPSSETDLIFHVMRPSPVRKNQKTLKCACHTKPRSMKSTELQAEQIEQCRGVGTNVFWLRVNCPFKLGAALIANYIYSIIQYDSVSIFIYK